MKKTFYIICVLFAGITQLFAQETSATEQNNNAQNDSKNKIISEDRKISGFENIDVNGRFKVILYQQDKVSITVVAPDEFMEYIETTVANNTLKIDMIKVDKSQKPGLLDRLKIKYNDYLIRQPIEIHVGVQNLKTIYASGASVVETKNNFQLNNLNIQLAGASKGLLKCNIVNHIFIDLSGASKLETEGTANSIKINSSGAAKFEGDNFKVKNAEVKSSGASKIEIFASEKLDAELGGASTVICNGSPKVVNQTSSRASKIVIK